jgi:hypothetical protein
MFESFEEIQDIMFATVDVLPKPLVHITLAYIGKDFYDRHLNPQIQITNIQNGSVYGHLKMIGFTQNSIELFNLRTGIKLEYQSPGTITSFKNHYSDVVCIIDRRIVYKFEKGQFHFIKHFDHVIKIDEIISFEYVILFTRNPGCYIIFNMLTNEEMDLGGYGMVMLLFFNFCVFDSPELNVLAIRNIRNHEVTKITIDKDVEQMFEINNIIYVVLISNQSFVRSMYKFHLVTYLLEFICHLPQYCFIFKSENILYGMTCDKFYKINLDIKHVECICSLETRDCRFYSRMNHGYLLYIDLIGCYHLLNIKTKESQIVHKNTSERMVFNGIDTFDDHGFILKNERCIGFLA